MTAFLVDNSVWQRERRSPSIADRIDVILAEGHEIVTCVPVMLEVGYSARNLADHQQTMEQLERLEILPGTEVSRTMALDIQEGLNRSGQGRSAGPMDVLIASLAMAHGAVVLHYDQDFDAIARAESLARSEWVVPRGSVA